MKYLFYFTFIWFWQISSGQILAQGNRIKYENIQNSLAKNIGKSPSSLVDFQLPGNLVNKENIIRSTKSLNQKHFYIVFDSSVKNNSDFALQKRIILKIDIFRLCWGIVSTSVEYKLTPEMSAEFGLGIIGLATYENTGFYFEKAQGAFLRAGMKFKLQPEIRRTNFICSPYLRPDIVLLHHINSGVIFGSSNNEVTNVSGFAAILNVGQQFEFSQKVVLDWFFGGGVGKKYLQRSINGNNVQMDEFTSSDSGSFAYGVFGFANNQMTISVQLGLKIGLMF